jgi:hypothetical protein
MQPYTFNERVPLAVAKLNASRKSKREMIQKSEQEIVVGYGKSLIFTLFLLAREINTDGRTVFLALLRLG